MKTSSSTLRRLRPWPAVVLSVAAATGCYIVPLYPVASSDYPPAQVAAAVPAPLTFTARMYPVNDVAMPYGLVTGVVTNELTGRGRFTASIAGESFTGEATRVDGSTREGIANGAGNRGSILNCKYKMNTATLGTGTCMLSNGAMFNMHIGG